MTVRNRSTLRLVLILFIVLVLSLLGRNISASDPESGTLNAPEGSGTASVTWEGGPYTVATPDPTLCVDSAVNCDVFELTLNIPNDYWDTHAGEVTIAINWESTGDDFDMFIYDSDGNQVDSATSGGTSSETIVLQKPEAGIYTIEVVAWLTINATYSGIATINGTALPPGMIFPEDKDDIMDMLTVDYPLNVVFVGYHPTPEEVAEIKEYIPERYQPTVAAKSPGGDEIQNTGAGLLNWNKNHLISSRPYFLGIRYNYQIRIIQASDDYAKALFAVANAYTAQGQDFQNSDVGEDLARYNTLYGHYRLLAKGGDPTYAVVNPTKTDLIDAFAVEDWIFNSRLDEEWACAFTDLETGECLSPAIIQPDVDAYYDPYYDKNGLNLDRMPQGLNAGSSFFFLDTFTPIYASNYFRTNAYHTWGTDKVVNNSIIPAPVEEGGSWRITDPDTGEWDGVDYGRTWGGRYRFHFVDLGAAPNNFESLSWLGAERQLSSDYPHGDPPIWQYLSDPLWNQEGDDCLADPQTTNYSGNTPCRMMPRLGRDVAYGLFFRSTAGYLYRPIPRGDVYWLAVSNWTDFYSRPQWVNDQLTAAPWYGVWWTDTTKLYKINQVGNNDDDVLRWLSSALPYARWVGREGEVIPLYDPTNNLPTGEYLDTSPKHEDLPAPNFHVHSTLLGADIVPEPLYPGDNNHVIATYGSSQVDLTNISIAIEKAKAFGVFGLGYDDSVSDTYMRDYIDAHRPGIADIVPGVNTIPSINMVFEKGYTWALPAIVGGIAVATEDGEAWGVMNNVNDRFKWSESHFPAVQPGDQPGSKRSLTDVSTPQQDSGTGFSYTIEHEAAHNLGLSHPHDGSYGVDKCETGPDAGEWECYWSGLGYMYDISAAPTTYAMAYRPYEVEDQDNLQRGHVAEYLVMAQDALRSRLIAEAQAGLTQPSAQWTSDYGRMQTWRDLAVELFGRGDYLHAEYAARNASLAARGIPQTPANTSDPKLVEAGQIFYFNVYPQQSNTGGQADLVIDDLSAADAPGSPWLTTLTATVTNNGTETAENFTVQFLEAGIHLADSAVVAALDAGQTTTVSYTWNTFYNRNSTVTFTAVADPDDIVDESDESNNQATRTVIFQGSKVFNGSFEQSSNGQSPDGWTGSGSTGYDNSGSNSSQGSGAVSVTGAGLPASVLNPTWTSAPIDVVPGETYNLALTVNAIGASSAPRVRIVYLNALGNVLSTVNGIVTTLNGTTGLQQVTGQIVIPAGVAQVKLLLVGFSPTDLNTQGTIWFDNVWMWTD